MFPSGWLLPPPAGAANDGLVVTAAASAGSMPLLGRSEISSATTTMPATRAVTVMTVTTLARFDQAAKSAMTYSES